MLELTIITNADGAWPELHGKKIHHVKSPIQVGRLKGGMQSGESCVAIRLDLPDGSHVIAETSMKLFLMCAKTFQILEIKDQGMMN